ncbi:MAG TPA: cystathionine beta-lyase [Syntrophomonas sp.]|jgi:cystathionine beta-lyase|nr:cystathionine beta-lyase [Syntrophomonas sp.]
MKYYDFNENIERRYTGCEKWDRFNCTLENKRIPLWVADMDFKCPPEVIEALIKRAEHGIFGYALCDDEYYHSIINWMAKRHNWQIDQEWICRSPGIVPAMDMLLRALTEPGDRVVIQTPVYHPFYSVIKNNKCSLLENPLLLQGNKYYMDFDDLEEKFRAGAKVIILCSPHNPVGRVWTRAELTQLGELAQSYDVLVISDEIHSDLVFPGVKHTVFGSWSEALAQQSVICNAPSKTFNLAGVQASNIIIPNPEIRNRYLSIIKNNGMETLNVFAVEALKTAYNCGEPWLEELLVYLKSNYDFICKFITQNIPLLKVIESEGTYLAWIDFRALGKDDADIEQKLIEETGLVLERGSIFGANGYGFQRLNFACPQSLLAESMNRLNSFVNA